MYKFSSVQLLSHVQLFVTTWTAARQASLSITNSQSLLKLMFIESVMPSNHLILCRPLLFLPSIFPSIRVFSNKSVLLIRWPKYWTFQWSASDLSMNIQDWFPLRLTDLLPVQGTLKSLLQNHSSKASIIQSSTVFLVQLSYPYVTTGKTITFTRRTFVGKVLSLLFNMPSTLVIAFLSRSKCLLISWLHSPSAVILEPPKIKSATVSTGRKKQGTLLLFLGSGRFWQFDLCFLCWVWLLSLGRNLSQFRAHPKCSLFQNLLKFPQSPSSEHTMD